MYICNCHGCRWSKIFGKVTETKFTLYFGVFFSKDYTITVCESQHFFFNFTLTLICSSVIYMYKSMLYFYQNDIRTINYIKTQFVSKILLTMFICYKIGLSAGESHDKWHSLTNCSSKLLMPDHILSWYWKMFYSPLFSECGIFPAFVSLECCISCISHVALSLFDIESNWIDSSPDILNGSDTLLFASHCSCSICSNRK